MLSAVAPAQFLSYPYRDRSDGLFQGVPGAALDDFEDGIDPTLPFAYSSGVVVGPGQFTDSVDGDDGIVDGDGTGGSSFYPNANSLTVTFAEVPFAAGLVLTDLGITPDDTSSLGFGTFVISAVDGLGNALGPVEIDFGDGMVTGETEEDTFVAFFSDNGIGAITVVAPLGSTDWEIDHVQQTVPEPVTLAALGLGALALRRRRR